MEHIGGKLALGGFSNTSVLAVGMFTDNDIQGDLNLPDIKKWKDLCQ